MRLDTPFFDRIRGRGSYINVTRICLRRIIFGQLISKSSTNFKEVDLPFPSIVHQCSFVACDLLVRTGFGRLFRDDYFSPDLLHQSNKLMWHKLYSDLIGIRSSYGNFVVVVGALNLKWYFLAETIMRTQSILL